MTGAAAGDIAVGAIGGGVMGIPFNAVPLTPPAVILADEPDGPAVTGPAICPVTPPPGYPTDTPYYVLCDSLKHAPADGQTQMPSHGAMGDGATGNGASGGGTGGGSGVGGQMLQTAPEADEISDADLLALVQEQHRQHVMHEQAVRNNLIAGGILALVLLVVFAIVRRERRRQRKQSET